MNLEPDDAFPTNQNQTVGPLEKNAESAPIAFFYENKPDKKFQESWQFTVDKKGKNWTTVETFCPLTSMNAGKMVTLKVRDDDWTLGEPDFRCNGTWLKPR